MLPLLALSPSLVPGCAASDPDGGDDRNDQTPEACFFGATFQEAVDQGRMVADKKLGFTLTTEAAIADMTAQIVAAAGTTGKSFASAGEVFRASQGGLVHVTFLEFQKQPSRKYTVVRFYPGGLPFGAIYREDELAPLALIQRGMITSCTEPGAGGCAFGATVDEAFTRLPIWADWALRLPESLSGFEREQAVAALEPVARDTGSEIKTVDDALGQSEMIEFLGFTAKDGRQFVAVRGAFIAQTIGAFFPAGSAEPVARFTGDKGEIFECTEPR
jgi:hypothetical protein